MTNNFRLLPSGTRSRRQKHSYLPKGHLKLEYSCHEFITKNIHKTGCLLADFPLSAYES